MAITEILQGCGAWDMTWKTTLPKSIRVAVEAAATVLVFDKPVTETGAAMMTEAVRQTALWEGAIVETTTGGMSGYELSWFLQKPNGDSLGLNDPDNPTFGTGPYGTVGALFDYAFSSTHSGGIYKGNVYSAAISSVIDTTLAPNPRDAAGIMFGARTWFDWFALEMSNKESLQFVWTVTPGGILNFHLATTLLRQDEVILTDVGPAKETRGVRVLPSVFNRTLSLAEYVNFLNYVDSAGAVSAATPGTSGMATVDRPRDARGAPLGFHRLLPEPTASGEVLAASQAAVETIDPAEATMAVILDPNARRSVGAGDTVYRYASEASEDGATAMLLNGSVVRPTSHTVTSITWEPTEGYSVIIRLPGERSDFDDSVITEPSYVDITKYVQLRQATPTTLTMADIWRPAWNRGTGNIDRLSFDFNPPIGTGGAFRPTDVPAPGDPRWSRVID